MPYGYFGARLENLALVGGKYDEIRRVADEGITWGGIVLHPGLMDDEDRERDAKATKHYLLIESEILLHHAAETLLRLYFGHATPGDPPCPWLAMAQRFDFAAFKDDVRRRFIEETRPTGRLTTAQRAELCAVFRGTDDPTKLTPSPTRRRWNAGLVNIDRFMRHYARLFLDDAPLYNPTKHGMGITASGDALFAIDGTAMAHGPAVTVLEIVDKNDRKGPRWRRTTRWFDFEHHTAFTYCAIILMRQLWTVGSWQYTGSKLELYTLFDRPLFRTVQDAAHKSPQMRVSFDLLYEPAVAMH